MTSVRLLAAIACLPAWCHREAPESSHAALPASHPTTVATSTVSEPLPRPTTTPAPVRPWCVRSLNGVDARAVDPRGHVLALQHNVLRDETAGTAVAPLTPAGGACPVDWNHIAFDREGNLGVWSHGHLFVAPRGTAVPVATPACSDLDGEPWAARTDGTGWAVIGRRAAGDLALLMTEDRTGSIGWYAITALSATMTAASLEGNGSVVVLESGGHALVIDRERHVAGEILAAADVTWDHMTRSRAGLVLSRDTDGSGRDVVLGTNVAGRFERQHRARTVANGGTTLGVWLLDFGRLVAVTDRGIEWSGGRDQPFVDVGRWPEEAVEAAGVATDHTLRPSVGWLPDGSPVVVTPSAWASPTCAGATR